MGFWILMAMLACALIAIIVALTIERQPASRRRPRRLNGVVRWLAVVPERHDQAGINWADRLAELLPPTVEPQLASSPGTTLTELEPSIREIVADRAPDVLVVWTALDDVLAGIPLPEYEAAFNDLLTRLDADGVTVVVGNVPDLSQLPGAVGAGLAERELRLLTDRWNGAIARLAHHHGALVADLRDLVPEPDLIESPDLNRAGGHDSTTSAAIAERFLPVLRQALVGARRRHLVSSAAESL